MYGLKVIGLPAFNEEKNIAKIILELQSVADEIIVCDDGSDDMTGVIAKKMGATLVTHEKNLGYGAAIRSLFLKAREMNADTLVTFDADGQHRVEDIASVIEPIITKKADIVIGSRFLGDKSNVPQYRQVGIKAITKITNLSTDTKVTDSQSGFRAYNKKVIESIVPSEYGMGVSTEILIKANQKKFRILEVPITVLYKGDTSTHNPVSHGTSVVMSTIKFMSIEKPLRFYGIPGMMFLVIGLFFIAWTIQEFSQTGMMITNVTLIGIGSTIFGMMLMVTSIILYSIVNVVRERHSN